MKKSKKHDRYYVWFLWKECFDFNDFIIDFNINIDEIENKDIINLYEMHTDFMNEDYTRIANDCLDSWIRPFRPIRSTNEKPIKGDFVTWCNMFTEYPEFGKLTDEHLIETKKLMKKDGLVNYLNEYMGI